MSRKNILHLTGMKSKKYGGLERYFVELVKLCNNKGYQSIFQYDFIPHSSNYLLKLEKLGAKVVVLNSKGSFVRSLLGIASLIYVVRPKVIQTHFIDIKILFASPIFARLCGVKKVVATVHSIPAMKKKSKRRFAYNNYQCISSFQCCS